MSWGVLETQGTLDSKMTEDALACTRSKVYRDSLALLDDTGVQRRSLRATRGQKMTQDALRCAGVMGRTVLPRVTRWNRML